jgi:hypothetical protein
MMCRLVQSRCNSFEHDRTSGSEMASSQKATLQSRETLRLPRGSRTSAPAPRAGSEHAAVEPTPRAWPRESSTALLQELLAESLWPLVEAAFRGVEDHVEARFFQLADLQVVISRDRLKGQAAREAPRGLTLEVWPSTGPRLLEIEWSGRRPYIVHRRDGDWLHRLIEISGTFRSPE